MTIINWKKIIWISEIAILALSYLAVYLASKSPLEYEISAVGPLGVVMTQFYFVTNILQLILFKFSFLEKWIRYSFVALQVLFLTFGNWIYSEPGRFYENYNLINGYKLVLTLSAFYFAFTLIRLISDSQQMPIKDITNIKILNKNLNFNPNAQQ
jgi:hypothetical protein